MLLMQKAASRQAIANKGFMVSTLNNPKIAYCRQRGSAVCEEVMNIEDATGLSQLIQSIFKGKTGLFCLHRFFMQNTHYLRLK